MTILALLAFALADLWPSGGGLRGVRSQNLVEAPRLSISRSTDKARVDE
jgi:hypothetical protein